MLKTLTIYLDLAWHQAPQWEKGQKTGWNRKNGGGLGRGNELRYPFPSLKYRSPFFFFFFWRTPIFLSFSPNAEPVPGLMKIIAELSCARSARSGEPWVTILVLRKSFFHRRGEISHFKHPRVSAVNHMATPSTRTFRGEKITTTKPSLSFD